MVIFFKLLQIYNARRKQSTKKRFIYPSFSQKKQVSYLRNQESCIKSIFFIEHSNRS